MPRTLHPQQIERADATIRVRAAGSKDAADIARLLGELGYPSARRMIARRLAALGDAGHSAQFVAVDGRAILGFLALRWEAMIHRQRPVARITTMVVSEAARRRGVGRLLVERALARARRAGCEGIEVTTGQQRREAHSFYEALGFRGGVLRYYRSIRDTPTSR